MTADLCHQLALCVDTALLQVCVWFGFFMQSGPSLGAQGDMLRVIL